MTVPTGAKVIAQALHDLGVTVIHTLVGIPVAEIAEEAIDLGIHVIGYRNEQACSYAASAYGYLTAQPGVCILTGGPGILHGTAGIGNASANAFPLLVLGGSSESSLSTKGGFQEMDAVALLTPQTKFATRPTSRDPPTIVAAIRNAYRIAWYGRPGPTFVDLPTEMIMEPVIAAARSAATSHSPIVVSPPPKPAGDPDLVRSAARLLRSASSPLVIVGKGAAYSRAEHSICNLVQTHHLPFLPTPMGKGIIPDSHPLNTSSARSTALKNADVILLLGARLNWILHFGEAPKYRPDVKIIQVDISAEELGRTNRLGQPSLSIFGDIGLVVDQLHHELGVEWKALPHATVRHPLSPSAQSPSSPYVTLLSKTASKNEARSHRLAHTPTPPGGHLTYERTYHILKSTLDALSPPEAGEIVYVSEGANTMDISRSAFPLERPRQRLDAGTYATMGVGMGYAIAAWTAHNLAPGHRHQLGGMKPKKIIALEGDSAFGFSAMEVETMARHNMDVMIVVMNNSGIYKGDALTRAAWTELQRQTTSRDTQAGAGAGAEDVQAEEDVVVVEEEKKTPRKKGLRSTSLLYETRYEKMADMVGGKGWFIRTEDEMAHAVRAAFVERGKVCVLNVIIDPGLNSAAQFGWMDQKDKHGGGGTSKL
ncbi:2-hydroxyacyl-CoA lyase 1 [Cladophialophora carrionii]|uniref:2-hydroxyacyl-CoA lyase n=1 Tax=Cladophialophora carrionii TaxID=86049 RepID=A0A1C1CL42_9EURO|nr:2-hydroxyacyl-CoA lyase 1 [Cladophialophora carrionii]